VSVAIIGDLVKEPNETFSLTVSNVSNASVADGYAIGTILNDDRR
jgi:chitinase